MELMLFSFEGWTSNDLVAMAEWTHLFSSRTQKLSTLTATISRRALVKIASCQVIIAHHSMSFFLYNKNFNASAETNKKKLSKMIASFIP